MRLLRRPTAFVLSLLLVQLSLVGGNASCGSHGVGDGGGTADHGGAHAAMGMDAGGPVATNPAHAPAFGSHDSCSTTRPSATDCSMPVSCAAPSLPVGAPLALDVALVAADAWAAPALARPAPLAAPELPPPRA